MYIRLLPPPRAKAFLLDWAALRELWALSWQSDERNRGRLLDAYSELWFGEDRRGRRRFIIGQVAYGGPEQPLMFGNGIHRSSVLARYSTVVPLAAGSDIYRRRATNHCVVREIGKDEEIRLPDLPVMSALHLRRAQWRRGNV